MKLKMWISVLDLMQGLVSEMYSYGIYVFNFLIYPQNNLILSEFIVIKNSVVTGIQLSNVGTHKAIVSAYCAQSSPIGCQDFCCN